MSYSDLRKDVENFGYKVVFERLFNERASALTKVENAKAQLKVNESLLRGVESDFHHLKSILERDSIVKQENGTLTVRHLVKDVVWQVDFLFNNEITCAVYPLTDLTPPGQ